MIVHMRVALRTVPASSLLTCCVVVGPRAAENYENWTQMPPLCDYLSLECLGKGNYRSAHIFGFGGPGLMIGQADVLMWEFAMARNPYIKNFVELGTVSGAGSLYFGVAARTRGGTLHTFDK
jgi:hypothetical protein